VNGIYLVVGWEQYSKTLSN